MSAPAWAEDPPRATLLDPGDTGLRDDLAWLADRRVIDLTQGQWPIAAAVVIDALRAQAPDAPLTEADRDALARVEQALRHASAAASLAFGVNTARHVPVGAAWPQRARGTATATARLAGESCAGQLSINMRSEPLGHDDDGPGIDGSYGACIGEFALAAAGQFDRWWGPTRYAAPILGNVAAPQASLLLRRAADSAPVSEWLQWIGPWSWELSVAQPRDYQPARPKAIGMRLTVRPLPGLELGAARYLYWGGEGRSESPGSLWRALTGSRSNIDDVAQDGPDPGNEIAGLDARWAVPLGDSTLMLYGQIAGEDEAGYLPSKRFGTVGAQWRHLVGADRWQWTLEATDTRMSALFGLDGASLGPVYTHSTYVTGHYHQGLPIGAFTGGGARIVVAGLDWTRTSDATQPRVEALLWHGRIASNGQVGINQAFPGDGEIYGASLALHASMPRWRWRVALDAQHAPATGRADWGVIGRVEFPWDARP
ncbi:capsule assembly Wzi family protein [Caldimonas sp. KR1-144]|uniref:capsule assembly Wzi family protein n=1 Tax=Caldimonas sp. KR1-144 TaxID=3400911 RepID=UPI003BFFBD59